MTMLGAVIEGINLEKLPLSSSADAALGVKWEHVPHVRQVHHNVVCLTCGTSCALWQLVRCVSSATTFYPMYNCRMEAVYWIETIHFICIPSLPTSAMDHMSNVNMSSMTYLTLPLSHSRA